MPKRSSTRKPQAPLPYEVLPDLLNTLELAHDLAATTHRRVRLTSEPTNDFAVMLYLEIIEFAGSLILLRQHNRAAGISIIARTALDAFVDLKLLLIDSTYWSSLELSDSLEWMKILQTASAKENQYLAGLRNDPNFPAYRKRMKKTLVAAKSKSAKHWSAEEKFIEAGMKNEYWGLHVMLSADVHNNTSHLKHRHARSNKGVVTISLYSGEGGYGDAVLLTMAEILMLSSEDIHDRYGEGKESVKGIRYVVDPARERAAMLDKKVPHQQAAT